MSDFYPYSELRYGFQIPIKPLAPPNIFLGIPRTEPRSYPAHRYTMDIIGNAKSWKLADIIAAVNDGNIYSRMLNAGYDINDLFERAQKNLNSRIEHMAVRLCVKSEYRRSFRREEATDLITAMYNALDKL